VTLPRFCGATARMQLSLCFLLSQWSHHSSLIVPSHLVIGCVFRQGTVGPNLATSEDLPRLKGTGNSLTSAPNVGRCIYGGHTWDRWSQSACDSSTSNGPIISKKQVHDMGPKWP
jgi:hypothetical protein